ncbi:hypothetical protein HZA85_00235 [Candidatus Uhrbacteria bacterium]|nr:hypothetical protein [Candidatus Uhrbacteria bacterium]
MPLVAPTLTILLYALVAWVLIEVFVNNAHRLSRKHFIFFHYVCVIAVFFGVFDFYFLHHQTFSIFAVTAIAMATVCALELMVFGYLYSGERWFLNYVDWIFPMFLALGTIYFTGVLVS